MFDNVCKFLVETFTADFATWLLGAPVPLTQLSPAELSLEPIRADALVLLEAAASVLHLEFQTRPDPDLPFRMADYRLRTHRRYPTKTMRQVVLYLKPSRSELVQQTVFAISGLRHEFEVVRLWECAPEAFLAAPGLLPLAILCRSTNQPETLRVIAQRIEAIPDPRTQSNIAAATSILAGLVLDKALVQQILREAVMRDSVIYQDILAQGVQQGRQEGRQEGEATLILRLLERRCGPIADATVAQVRSLSVAQLESLGEALLDFQGPADLATWLQALPPT